METNIPGRGLRSQYDNIWLVDGVRTPFADYNTVLGLVSPIDLGIKVAREIFRRTEVSPEWVGSVVAGNMAQASFDAYVLPRHIGIYSGVPIEVPAHLVQRVCGTGIEAICQAADAIKLGKVELALVVGTESMSRNPIAAYTHRGGFRMGQVEFKDFLWEALLDTCPGVTMGGSAEALAKQYKISREEADQFAAESFSRAIDAQKRCFLSGEIVPVVSQLFECEGYNARSIRLPKKVESFSQDSHIRPWPSCRLHSAEFRPAGTVRASWMAQLRRWSLPAILCANTIGQHWRRWSRARQWACLRKLWV
jgi:acetyl-CoA C-acetyltransferase